MLVAQFNMRLLTVTITPYDVSAVPRVLPWAPKSRIHLYYLCVKLAWAVVSVYKTGNAVRDTKDSDKWYVVNSAGDILLSISVEQTPASYDNQLALNL